MAETNSNHSVAKADQQVLEQKELQSNWESHSRRPLHRQPSVVGSSTPNQRVSLQDSDLYEEDIQAQWQENKGLGLGQICEEPAPFYIKRVPVGYKGSKESLASTQKSVRTPASPMANLATFSQTTTAQNTPAKDRERSTGYWTTFDNPSQYASTSHPHLHSMTSTTGLLNNQERIDHSCPTQGDILTSQLSWFSGSVMLLAVYSAIFSGIFLGVALAKPRWGEKIGKTGHLSFANATLLSALFSKTIELSFTTVFVALLGQILSRRAFSPEPKKGGISIAETNMRSWIMQPGTLVTNVTGVRLAGRGLLGMVALIAAVAATFYTTAAEALVSPKLKPGPWEPWTLKGQVTTSFANGTYMSQECETPITTQVDFNYSGSTCLQIQHAGQSFRNLQQYMRTWTELVSTGDLLQHSRPSPFAMLWDNTTVHGSFITPSGEDLVKDSAQHRRLVLNVTAAMPHSGLYRAARDPINKILQPEDLQGNGEYNVKGALPAPTINVLCVGMSEDEIQPLLFEGTTDTPKIPSGWPSPTVVDDLFEWGNTSLNYPPLFAKAPHVYNTVVNSGESANIWGPSSVYLMVKPPGDIITNNYTVCSLKATLYPNCTSALYVAQTGGRFSVHCDQDLENNVSYDRKIQEQNGTTSTGLWNQDWKNVGNEWIRSVALSQGVSDANASISRLMSQMVPAYDAQTNRAVLNSSSPTIAEALAVLAGSTLLTSAMDAPFVQFWNYTHVDPESPEYQYFPALLSFTDYASGGTQSWQAIFYLVLVVVFVLNVFGTAYLLWQFVFEGQVTDYTEPQNLFALAMNSPPAVALSGSCGSGPNSMMLGKRWHVEKQDTDHYHPHFYASFDSGIDVPRQGSTVAAQVDRGGPHLRSRSRHNRQDSSLTEDDFDIDQSPAVAQYLKLIGR